MSEALSHPDVDAVLARFEAAAAELNAVALTRCSDGDVPAILARVETVRRTSAVLDQKMVAEIESRSLPYRHGSATTATFLRQLLRIPIAEARSRVANARAAGARIRSDGEPVGPVFTVVAAAQAEGAISRAHAAVIVQTVEKLPDDVQAEVGATIEAQLVEHARGLDFDTLARFATQLRAALDQDGLLDDAAYRARTRDVRVSVRRDGSAHLSGELTAEATEHLRTVLDVLAKPVAGPDGERDPRTAGQRNHDALIELCKTSARAELLPMAGGVTTTLLLTMTREAFTAGIGSARTGHGVVIAAETAKAWIDGETRIVGVVFDSAGQAEAFTTPARLFTENQRLAMIARDGGCAFPGCEAPPQRCESHHVLEWVAGGPTSTGNGVLLCRYHHHHFQDMGWRCTMVDDVPHFIPPAWLDHDQVPIRNWLSHRVLQPG